jgi:hypothetical protein
MDSGAIGGVNGENILNLSIIELSKVDISDVSDTTVLDLTLCQGASVITRKVVEKTLESSTSTQTWERGDPSTLWLNWRILVCRLMHNLNT